MGKPTMTPKNKTRLTFDFTFEVEGERRKSYEKLFRLFARHVGEPALIFSAL